MTQSLWRERANTVIRRVLDALPPDTPLAAKRKALREAYPFGERAHHPYKIWCDAVRVALGLKPGRAAPAPDPKQRLLFED